MKRFGISLAGGILGGALVVGGFVTYNKVDNPTTNSATSTELKTTNTNKGKVTNVSTQNISTDVTTAVDKMQNAVVSIETLQKQQKSQLSDLEQFFGTADDSKNNDGDLKEAAEGSGVIYRKDGNKAYVVTNNHVVENADAVEILLNGGDKVTAKIIGTDVYSDLAVLEIPSEKVKAIAEFANSDDIKVGEPALAMGSPLGSTFANSVSQGIISAKDRVITNTTEDGQPININALQTDAAINPGNSGGPLVNLSGQVIGINSSKIAQAASGVATEGLGFAIPSNNVVSIINQLEKNGKVIRPMLGATMIDLAYVSAADRQDVLKLKDKGLTGGVVLGSVIKGSPAEKAGLKKFVVITKVDDKNVETRSELQSILYSKKVGDSMKLTYYYNGKEESTTVKLDQDSSQLDKENAQQSKQRAAQKNQQDEQGSQTQDRDAFQQ
ncbi:serine protease [Vagococcus vulneris]|uniref:Serine protease n=2 Tax=Vagococcus vulneris TaxID=1977869 RepID=A0A429ZYY7_9ENTE|nr:trypsin-like peptidase domain-containing protein [Vagococcus vulneris]RST99175.1 serine protease [Vagococcus vulneris]